MTQQQIDGMNKAAVRAGAGLPPEYTPAAVTPMRHFVLLMPMWATADERMKAWASAEGHMEASASLPALMKPYLDIDITRTSLLDLKNILAYLLRQKNCLHDSRAATVHVEPRDIDLYIDWAPASAATPDWLLQEPLPQPYDVSLGEKKDFSLLAVVGMLVQNKVDIAPTIDLTYCRRAQ